MGNMDSNGDVGGASRETKIVKYYNATRDYASAFSKLLDEDVGSYADKDYKWSNHDNSEINELISQDKYNEIFTNIEEKLLVAADNPSYIIDEIGFGKYSDNTNYDLEFVNDINNIDVLEGTNKLDKEMISDNTYGF